VILGVDEAGRGRVVGRLYVACVLSVPDDPGLVGLNDSKKLTEEKRLELYPNLIRLCEYGVGWVEAEEIDSSGNVWHAEQVAIDRAISDLKSKFEVPKTTVLVMDGNVFPKRIDWPMMRMRCAVRADSKYREVMAASVIAKTESDAWILRRPEAETYGWNVNHGYLDDLHLERLRLHGPSSIHRRSFHIRGLDGDDRFPHGSYINNEKEGEDAQSQI